MRPELLQTRPTVSVVIPCYNYGHYLPAAVHGVLGQPGVDLEVIIVDDASTDGSDRVARALAEQDPRVHVVQHESNKRHIATYNDGLAQVTGDYVVLLSADDMLAPGSLERSVALMEAHPRVGLVYGYSPRFDDVVPEARTHVRSWTVWSGPDWIGRICTRGTNIIQNPEAVMRRSVLDKIGGYDPDLPHSADMVMWMQAAALGDVGRVNGADQAFYRVHGSNMHTTDYGGLLTDMVERRRAFELFFTNDGAELPSAGKQLATARRAIAVEALRVARLALDGQAGHHGVGQAEAAGFVDFAAQTSPAITGTFLWRSVARRSTRPASATSRRIVARTHSLRWSLRWRRWRRFGT